MPPLILSDVMAKLSMRPNDTVILQRSNDRPNIQLVVEEMQYSASSMHDIDRVLRLDELEDGKAPPKFMVFVNRRRDGEDLAGYERQKLSPQLQEKVVWFHSGMSQTFREASIAKLKAGELWGVICTDAAGMVSTSLFRCSS